MIAFYEKLNDLLVSSTPFVSVTVVDAQGSVPQDIGAKMLVTTDGLFFGTVGGGKVEARAIKEAQQLLLSSNSDPKNRNGDFKSTQFSSWSLDKDIGMTCGGSVRVYFEAFNTRMWQIALFGAGHCALALANILVNLDCQVTCFDTRQEWLDKMPKSPKFKCVHDADLPSRAKDIPDNAFVLLMTMGHSSDKPILLEILKGWKQRQFPYLGVIGSDAKAVRLKKDIQEAGLPDEYKNLFFCPIGLDIGNNHPQEIAVSVSAQLLQQRSRKHHEQQTHLLQANACTQERDVL